MALPLATPELAGTGGHMGPLDTDFRVMEIPRYPPSGEGEHCFVRIRKTGLTSWEAGARLARALGRRPADVGMAGIKDRHAATEQWVSLPDVAPTDALGVALEDVQVLEAVRHGHKLRTGHLAGNRFVVRLTGVCEDALARAEAILGQVASKGTFHGFGPQRFGARGDNAQRARELLTGRLRIRDRRQRRLMLSALQSELFNAYLAARVELPLEAPLPGELVQKTDSGGIFPAEDLTEVAARMACRKVVITGPLFGSKMRRPAPPSSAFALEERVLQAAGLTPESFAPFKRIAPGARRPLVLWPQEAAVRALDGGLEVQFTLPPGGYATVLLREITKTPFEALRPAPLAPSPEIP